MIKAIVTDIEGTTSSLSFVKDVLFPYAREHLADFVHQHKDDASVRELLDQANVEAGGGLDDDKVLDQLIRWIDEDRKVTPLKSLQGLIWEQGYRNGDYTGHIYADAVNKLRQWHELGIRLYVYSSGSIYAQKLLFAHTDYGDLTPLFSGYFDTHIGHKQEPESYQEIARELDLPSEEILFLSDIRQELDAARAAGMQTCWLVREQAPDPEADHPQFSSFDTISF
ncbi:MAG: acireductone synthase [Acidiferrobacterales bacterium]|nr:acireductone synthase [Acidiferrobacterales bacterium]